MGNGMVNIKLPPLPNFREWPYSHEELRARDLEVARVVLEGAAKYVEGLPCACCWPEGSDSVAEEFSAGIRALEIRNA